MALARLCYKKNVYYQTQAVVIKLVNGFNSNLSPLTRICLCFTPVPNPYAPISA